MKLLRTFGLIAALALVPISAQAACWQWSTTASSNATADPTINWSEGMAPSAVNNSARAMMARIAECRDDYSGKLETAGTATAYTLTTNQGLNATPTTGQMLAFRPSVTNGVNPTLTVDGGNTYPLESAPGVAVSSATLVQGTPYTVAFSGSGWVLRGFFGNPLAVPLGALLPYSGSSPPNSNYVMPAGQCISRTTYAAYFALVGITYGGCDGSTTFAVPDLRGRTPFGVDNMGGTAANRITSAGSSLDGTVLGAGGGGQNATLLTANLPPYTPSGSIAITDPGHTHTTGTVGTAFFGAQGGSTTNAPAGSGSSTTSVAFTGVTAAFTGTAQGGTSTPVRTLNPGLMLNYILRVL